ncbi:MAG: hypothetical protein ACI837_001965 [Crocinitomicaceae bacterium]|jgi:hypothetical protein
MGKCVCSGAQLKCSFGTSPANFLVLPLNMVNTTSMPAGTIMDYIPVLNVPPFGQCSSPSNPMVIAAFGAPQPCIPVTIAPWSPGSPTVKIGKLNALDEADKLLCMWAGSIEITDTGQADVSMDN